MEPLETRGDISDSTSLIPNSTKKKNKKFSTKWILIITVFIIILTTIITIGILMYFDIIPNFLRNDKSEDDKPSGLAGVFGKFSSHGGNPSNQQIAGSDVILNEHNIKNVTVLCEHNGGGNTAYTGYITVDDEDYGYITDGSGTVYKMNLSTCTEIWTINVANILGYNSSEGAIIINRQTVTLFKSSNGSKGLLFGAPSSGRSGISVHDPCWAIALNVSDGSLLWKTNLGGTLKNWNCLAHGFMVDPNDHYAYGGITNNNARTTQTLIFEAVVRGRMIKLDIDNGDIIDIFYSIDNDKYGFDDDLVNVSNPYEYRGASFWNMQAIIGDYIIAGTGNLLTHPKYIENCLLFEDYNNSLDINNVHKYDPCGNDRTSSEQFHKFWRCLEKGVYPSSFIILNKKTFKLEKGIPLQGVDIEQTKCRNSLLTGCMKVQGPDADLAAVAGYTDPRDGKLYGAAAQKSGTFWVFAIPSGEAIIAKKVGGWSFNGGSQWSIAVDETNLIAIVTITGGNTRSTQQYKTILANGEEVCDQTGSVHAINLTNSDTIWQMYNPWGTIGKIACNNSIYDEYFDYSKEMQCETDNVINPAETVINVVTAPINKSERISASAQLVAPVMIVHNMVFIPSYSGDIFIHNLFNGKYIHTLTCPNEQQIKGGITVVDDRVLVYCGSNTVVSMKLSY